MFVCIHTHSYIEFANTNTHMYRVFAFDVPPNLPMAAYFHHSLTCQPLSFLLRPLWLEQFLTIPQLLTLPFNLLFFLYLIIT